MDFIKPNPILEFQPDTLNAIRKVYNLDEERMKQSIDIIEEWIKKQNHFVNKNFDRDYIERTVIASKGSVEKAKLQIDRLCTLKTLVPKFFIGGDIRKNFEEVTKIAYAVLLPKMMKDHTRVFMIKINDKEFTAEHYLDYYRLAIALCEYLKANDYTNGYVIVEDFRDINLMELLKKINLIDLQQVMTVLIEGYGARLLGIHIISQSKVLEIFLKTIKPWLTPKIVSRIHIHQDIDDILGLVDRDILPVEYGGKEKSIPELQEQWLNVLSSDKFESYLAETSKTCTDETLRQRDKFNEECVGLPGSFRTLSVD